MKYPDFLREGGTIGFVAPSFGCATEPYRSAFTHALNRFQKLGFNVVTGPNCFADQGIGISNTPRACGGELNHYYCGKECDVLISCGGGELMCEVVPWMDFERMKGVQPKWYMGYSDNTNFTFLLATICDTAAIYGPCAASFGMEPWHPSLQDAFDLLRGVSDRVHGYDLWEKEKLRDEEHPMEPYHVTERTQLRIVVPDSGNSIGEGGFRSQAGTGESANTDVENGIADNRKDEHPEESFKGTLDREVVSCVHPVVETSFEGRLIGGCMDCLVTLLGTRFDQVREFNSRYKEDGIIWFLESCDLNVMGIRRAVWQMKNAGWFEYVRGFLIGRPLCYGEEAFGIDQYRAVTDLIGEYGVPIVMDVDIGHLPPMMPMVCGATAEVKVKADQIEVHYTWK